MPYGFVAVAAGAGMQALFQDLGVNSVVTGGQTMNPSTEDILKAIHATPAETVFVLPNNKNIIMAAEQAIKLADRRVCVLPDSAPSPREFPLCSPLTPIRASAKTGLA